MKPLAALLQERNVSRAAALLHVSLPAMSRTLQRLRRVFRDDILVGRAGGYELTPAGRRLRRRLIGTVTWCVKARPFGVSDATDIGVRANSRMKADE